MYLCCVFLVLEKRHVVHKLMLRNSHKIPIHLDRQVSCNSEDVNILFYFSLSSSIDEPRLLSKSKTLPYWNIKQTPGPSLYEQEAAFAQQLGDDGYHKIIEKHQDMSDLGMQRIDLYSYDCVFNPIPFSRRYCSLLLSMYKLKWTSYIFYWLYGAWVASRMQSLYLKGIIKSGACRDMDLQIVANYLVQGT